MTKVNREVGKLFEGNITREQAIIIGLGRNEDGLVDYEVDGMCLGEWLQRVITNMVSQTRNDLLREIMEEMPKKKDIVYANGDLRELANYHEEIGFNDYHDQVNTLLESKLSTVKKR